MSEDVALERASGDCLRMLVKNAFIRCQRKVVSSDWVPNPQFYINYQDCHYQGVEYMSCGGVATYSSPLGDIAFGGLDLLDLRSTTTRQTC